MERSNSIRPQLKRLRILWNEKLKMMNNCKNCKHWKSQQAELDYSQFYGICTNSKLKFTITGSSDCVVLDRKNRNTTHMGVHRFENQSNVVPYGKVEPSQYCFVTEEKFGCINFEPIKSKK